MKSDGHLLDEKAFGVVLWLPVGGELVPEFLDGFFVAFLEF